MVSYKLALDERRAKQDGTFPLVVRVTFNRKVSTYQTGIFLKSEHWDKNTLQVAKTASNSLSLSSKATEFYVKVQKAILTIENNQEFTFEELKNLLYPTIVKKEKQKSFKDYAECVMADMRKSGRTGGALVYLTAVNRLIDYCGNKDILFSEIDYTFLDGFKSKLLEQGLKKNSVGNYFRSIRALYNKAIKAKIVSRDLYPFHDIPIKTEKTAKRAIKIEELKRLYMEPKEADSQEWQMSGYVININSQSIRKINLQVVTTNRNLVVVGLKELQDNYWITFSVNKPIAEKLTYGEAFSDRFEYKVYIPTLGQTVYF